MVENNLTYPSMNTVTQKKRRSKKTQKNPAHNYVKTDSNGVKYVNIWELPDEERLQFRRYLANKAIPIIGGVKLAAFAQDYLHWKKLFTLED